MVRPQRPSDLSRCPLILAALLAFCFGGKQVGHAQNRIRLTDVTSATGVDFRHDDGSQGQYYIFETMSGGLALFDYDLDGDIDIYFLNGRRSPTKGHSPQNVLYRNDGDWRFTDVTDDARVGDAGHGLGVAVGDYDNDGDPDIYVNNYGPNVLYRNEGDGTFSDQTAAAGVANGQRFGAGACFFDMDADGDLDLYVANYVKADRENHVPRTKQGFPIYGSPIDYEPESDTLFRNDGDGKFSDVTRASGVDQVAAPSMGMVCCDYDVDGDTDVLVANDGVANTLMQNDGTGKFIDVGLLTGFAYDSAGKTHASMGVDAGDYDRDGRIDFHVTSFQGELATLYRNVPGNFLEDVTNQVGAAKGTRKPVTWGNGFADFDNDGDLDLFVACGHLYDLLHKFDPTSSYETPNVLLENLDGKRFADVSADAGGGMLVKATSRGVAFDDLDNDGDVDGVVINNRGMATLLRNDTVTDHGWLQVRLRGVKANRDGVGARVTVVSRDGPQVAEVHSGRGYQSHFGTQLHFGLGKSKQPVTIRVKWPNGSFTEMQQVTPNQRITVTESVP